MKNPTIQTRIVEPPYFSNWADQFFPKIAHMILPFILPYNWITPNLVTVVSFAIYTLACLSLFLQFPFHLLVGAILLPIAYIGDCLDGQLARTKRLFSELGNYLDKVLDVLKIYIITGSLSFAVYQQSHNILHLFLGLTACFFFNFRYYIKLETIFAAISRDPEYLQKSKDKRESLYEDLNEIYSNLKKTPLGRLKLFWLKNRTLFIVDEAEFVVITSLGALLNQLTLALWIIAISQLAISIFRFSERANQTATKSSRLLWPMRK